MPLQSKLLAGNHRLEGCLVRDSDHVTPGTQGYFVRLIQAALIAIDRFYIDEKEIEQERYGPSTANAVLRFKQKRDIINRSYQTTADNIVGKMTIAALDKELCELEEKRKKRPLRARELDQSPQTLRERIARGFIVAEVERARAERMSSGRKS